MVTTLLGWHLAAGPGSLASIPSRTYTSISIHDEAFKPPANKISTSVEIANGQRYISIKMRL